MQNRLKEINNKLQSALKNVEYDTAVIIGSMFSEIVRELQQAQEEIFKLRNEKFEQWKELIKVDGQLCAMCDRIVSLKSQLQQAQEENKQLRRSKEIDVNRLIDASMKASNGTLDMYMGCDTPDHLADLILEAQDRERVLREALEQLVGQCENAPHQGNCEGPFAWSINVARKALRKDDENAS